MVWATGRDGDPQLLVRYRFDSEKVVLCHQGSCLCHLSPSTLCLPSWWALPPGLQMSPLSPYLAWLAAGLPGVLGASKPRALRAQGSGSYQLQTEWGSANRAGPTGNNLGLGAPFKAQLDPRLLLFSLSSQKLASNRWVMQLDT